MGTTADKLSYLSDTKEAIKEAIINKGQAVSDEDTFRSYADKISQIQTGGEIEVEALSITENGTYTAESGHAYSPIAVSVTPEVERLDVTENGTYSADTGKGYTPVVVNVKPDLERLDVTENGTYTPSGDGFNLVTVNVASPTGKGEDGNDYSAVVDEDGNISLSKVPSSMKITTEPTKYYYDDGEDIDITGMIAKLYDGNDELYTTGYVDGIVSNSDITVNPTIASYDENGEKVLVPIEGRSLNNITVSGTTINGPIMGNQISRDSVVANNGANILFDIGGSSPIYGTWYLKPSSSNEKCVIFASESSFYGKLKGNMYNATISSNSTTIEGKTVYYYNWVVNYTCYLPESADNTEGSATLVAYMLLYGDYEVEPTYAVIPNRLLLASKNSYLMYAMHDSDHEVRGYISLNSENNQWDFKFISEYPFKYNVSWEGSYPIQNASLDSKSGYYIGNTYDQTPDYSAFQWSFDIVNDSRKSAYECAYGDSAVAPQYAVKQTITASYTYPTNNKVLSDTFEIQVSAPTDNTDE